jgi:hypothetical protein
MLCLWPWLRRGALLYRIFGNLWHQELILQDRTKLKVTVASFAQCVQVAMKQMFVLEELEIFYSVSCAIYYFLKILNLQERSFIAVDKLKVF